MKTPNPNNDNDLLVRAQSLLNSGDFPESIAIFQNLLERHGHNARLLHLAGTAALQAGHNEMAIDLFRRSISLDASQADTYSHLGIAYWNIKDFSEAESCYRSAINADPSYAEAYNNLCMVMQDGFKKPEMALELANKAIQIRPDYADAYNNRGNILQALDRFEEALASYDQSIAIKPDSASAHNNRGNALRKLDRPADSLSAYQEAISINPSYAEAYCNMGCALVDLGIVDDARRFYQRSISLDPEFANSYFNLGTLEASINNHELASDLYDKSIALNPSFADAYWNKALLKLLIGDYKEGFRLYKWGWTNRIRGKPRGFSQPEWLGNESLSGKRLLIHQEQGIGDCVHYARYVEQAVSLGATVILETVKPLIPLLESMKVPCKFVAIGEELPEFDYFIPLMSLPLAFETTLETLPRPVPYLFPEISLLKSWSERLGARVRPRVGLVWSGSTLHKNDHNRSMPLKELLPLLSLPLEFHCLQKEIRDEDRTCLPALPMIHTHDDAIGDFADTASLIELMDLVISVDTSVAHVAGAMGKPIWIMIPAAPDWRWLLNRDDSPWYPTARLFRQNKTGDWGHVVKQVRTAVESSLLNLGTAS